MEFLLLVLKFFYMLYDGKIHFKMDFNIQLSTAVFILEITKTL